MPGLIPLLLNPVAAGNRTSVVFAAADKGHTRGQSLSHLPVAARSPQSPSTLSFNVTRRASMPPFQAKPTAHTLPPSPPCLLALPYTADEWRRTIADIKRQHLNRKYQACFTRCQEILTNIKAIHDVEPAYLISLHFYAATSMEMCTRLCLGPITHRESLIQQALYHYDQAAVLICRAEETVFSRSRPSSVMSSVSSLHSPSGSVSSRAWTPETALSSPTASVCSSEDLIARSQQSQMDYPLPSRPARKKVSFELPPPEPEVKGPFIRPDSPTLGFDDEYFTSALCRSALPEVPKRSQTPECEQLDEQDLTPRALKRQVDILDSSRDEIRDSFLMHSSEHRYCLHLSTLKTQISLHKASLDAVFEDRPSESYELLARAATPISDELRDLDKKARIARLRRSGWQRKRFDPSRYEALRTSVLAELS